MYKDIRELGTKSMPINLISHNQITACLIKRIKFCCLQDQLNNLQTSDNDQRDVKYYFNICPIYIYIKSKGIHKMFILLKLPFI